MFALSWHNAYGTFFPFTAKHSPPSPAITYNFINGRAFSDAHQPSHAIDINRNRIVPLVLHRSAATHLPTFHIQLANAPSPYFAKSLYGLDGLSATLLSPPTPTPAPLPYAIGLSHPAIRNLNFHSALYANAITPAAAPIIHHYHQHQLATPLPQSILF